MAVATAAAPTTAFSFSPGKLQPKPLMLKDFLLDDLSSESFRATPTPGRPQQTTTVRYLLEMEHKKSRSNCAREWLLKGRSKNPFNKISAILNAVGILPFISSSSSCPSCSSNAAQSKQSLLTRGFSRRLLRRSFWNKRGRGRTEPCSSPNANPSSKGRMLIGDIVRISSFTDEARDGKTVHVPADLCAPASPMAVSSSRNSCSCSSSSSCWWESASLSSAYDSLPSPPMLDVSSDFANPEANSLEKKKKKTGTTTVNSPSSVTCDGPDGAVGGGSTSTETATSHRDPKKVAGTGRMKCTCNPYDDKDQFSPVSIMDFPYEAEEEPEYAPATPPSPFYQSLAKLESARHHLLCRIRRFETFLPSVDPTDLDDDSPPEKQSELERWGDSDTEEEVEDEALIARELVKQIKIGGGSSEWRGDDELLLLDFFIEELRAEKKRRELTWRVKLERRKAQTVGEELLLCAARDWLDGTGRFAIDRTGIESQIEEMEGYGRWRCFRGEEDEIAAHVESRVFGSLVEDLLHELLAF